MENLEYIDKFAKLHGESASCLIIGSINRLTNDAIGFDVKVSSEWYLAKINVHASIERLRNFTQQMSELISLTEKKIGFINELGNFDLELTVTSTGSVEVKGLMSKNMIDDLELHFGFSSTLTDVDRFHKSLSTATIF